MSKGVLFIAFLAFLAVIFLWRAIRRARNIQRAFGPQALADYRFFKPEGGGRAAGLRALGVTEKELDFIARHGEPPPESKPSTFDEGSGSDSSPR